MRLRKELLVGQSKWSDRYHCSTCTNLHIARRNKYKKPQRVAKRTQLSVLRAQSQNGNLARVLQRYTLRRWGVKQRIKSLKRGQTAVHSVIFLLYTACGRIALGNTTIERLYIWALWNWMMGHFRISLYIHCADAQVAIVNPNLINDLDILRSFYAAV